MWACALEHVVAEQAVASLLGRTAFVEERSVADALDREASEEESVGSNPGPDRQPRSPTTADIAAEDTVAEKRTAEGKVDATEESVGSHHSFSVLEVFWVCTLAAG